MGRSAGTHSKTITWSELCEEAYASGLHPWEFDRYTIEEYVLRRRGKVKSRRIELQQDFQHIRVLARYFIMPYLKKNDKKTQLDDLVPDIYETDTGKGALKDRVKAITEKYKQLGILK